MKGVDGRGRQSYSPWRHNQNFFHRFFGYNLPRVTHDQRLKRVHSKRERVINIIGLNLNIYSLTVNCALVVIPLLSACTASLGHMCKYAFRRGIMRPLGKRQVTDPHVKWLRLSCEQRFLSCIAFSLHEVVRVTCLSRSWFIYAPGGFSRLTEATRTTF